MSGTYRQPPYGIPLGGTGATTISGAQTNLQVPASSAVMLLNGTQAMAASLPMGGFTITNLGTPVNSTDAANKAYVDNLAAGVRTVGVRVATTGSNITLSGSAPNTLDGVTLAANDLILVKDQTTQSQNGIYYVSTLGTGSNGTWSRASTWTTSANYSLTVNAYVDDGTQNAGTEWVLPIDPDNPPTLGTTSLVFSESTSGTILAGNGLTKSGNTISAVAANSTITVSGSGIAVSATYSGNTSLVTVGTITTGVWNGTNIAVANGGTGASSASSARSNLSAAPNTPIYWLGATNGELSSAVVPSGGTGILVTATTGVIAVDTTVVATSSNTLTMTNKTLTSPTINSPTISSPLFKVPWTQKTSSYAAAATDSNIRFKITSSANATLPASAGMADGQVISFMNDDKSTANLSIICAGSDTGCNGVLSSSTTTNAIGIAYPGDVLAFAWDSSNSEYTAVG